MMVDFGRALAFFSDCWYNKEKQSKIPKEVNQKMELQQKRFAKNDDGFICAHCGREVEPLGYSSRKQKLLGPYLGVAMLSCNFEGAPTPRIWSLLALIPITLYNGKPGKYKLKYFFYIFYPAHLVLLYAIDVLLTLLGR